MHETRQSTPRPADQTTEHDEREWRVSGDDPGRGLRHSADMDWATPIYHAYFPDRFILPIYPEQHPDAGDGGSVDLSAGDPAGGASPGHHLRPNPNPNAGATTPHPDPDQGVVVPGRPVRLTYGDGLPGSIAFAIPDTDSDLPGLHHPRTTGDDLSGALWQGGSAFAHAAAGGTTGATLTLEHVELSVDPDDYPVN
jgi:hypothetical protein